MRPLHSQTDQWVCGPTNVSSGSIVRVRRIDKPPFEANLCWTAGDRRIAARVWPGVHGPQRRSRLNCSSGGFRSTPGVQVAEMCRYQWSALGRTLPINPQLARLRAFQVPPALHRRLPNRGRRQPSRHGEPADLFDDGNSLWHAETICRIAVHEHRDALIRHVTLRKATLD